MQSKPNRRSNFFINSNSWSIFLYEKWFGKQFEIAEQSLSDKRQYLEKIFDYFWCHFSLEALFSILSEKTQKTLLKNWRDGILKMMESKSGVY